ncbi:hypothetical protein V1523DRAFT_419050, partial [Lipomyces doorenjongii]
MARTNKRSRPEAIQPSQFIEPCEEDTITVSSPPRPLLPEERFDYPHLLIQKILLILLYLCLRSRTRVYGGWTYQHGPQKSGPRL